MDLYNLVVSAKLTKGGGGDEPVLIDKSITSNGTYNASSDDADGYKKVVANVPNTYAAGDEGKVVSNGALASQTSTTKTSNGTYDTTTNNEVVVNVPQPSGSISITQNGTVDVAQYASANVNVSGGGGGASNVVVGTFKFDGTTSHAENVTIDYSGNGYPVYAMITISGGLLENTDYASLIRRYAYLTYAINKSAASTTPNWSGSGDADQSAYVAQYKNSTSSATTYSQAGSYSNYSFNNANATANSAHTKVVQFKDAKTMSVWVTASGTEAYGFPSGIKYDYVIIYSE